MRRRPERRRLLQGGTGAAVAAATVGVVAAAMATATAAKHGGIESGIGTAARGYDANDKSTVSACREGMGAGMRVGACAAAQRKGR